MAEDCPKCGHDHVIKSGKVRGEQRWKCRECSYQFTRETPRGRPLWQKSLAVFLYCHGVSMNALARMFDVQPSTVMKWVRYSTNDQPGKPEPAGVVTVMDFEEMWKHLKGSRPEENDGRLWIAIYDKDINGNLGLSIQPPEGKKKKP
jgi:transposase-like protein